LGEGTSHSRVLLNGSGQKGGGNIKRWNLPVGTERDLSKEKGLCFCRWVWLRMRYRQERGGCWTGEIGTHVGQKERGSITATGQASHRLSPGRSVEGGSGRLLGELHKWVKKFGREVERAASLS